MNDSSSSDSDAYSDNEFEPDLGPRKKKNPKISNNNADTSELTSSKIKVASRTVGKKKHAI